MIDKIKIYNANSNDIVYPETSYDQVKGDTPNTVLGYDENSNPILIDKSELGGGGGKLFYHKIYSSYVLSGLDITIISSRSEVFTADSLITYLIDKGAASNDTAIPSHGYLGGVTGPIKGTVTYIFGGTKNRLGVGGINTTGAINYDVSYNDLSSCTFSVREI